MIEFNIKKKMKIIDNTHYMNEEEMLIIIYLTLACIKTHFIHIIQFFQRISHKGN